MTTSDWLRVATLCAIVVNVALLGLFHIYYRRTQDAMIRRIDLLQRRVDRIEGYVAPTDRVDVRDRG